MFEMCLILTWTDKFSENFGSNMSKGYHPFLCFFMKIDVLKYKGLQTNMFTIFVAVIQRALHVQQVQGWSANISVGF